MPALIGEQFPDALRLAVGNHAIQALAVQIDDPEDISQLGEIILPQGFPNIPLVQLPISDQSDKAPRRTTAEVIQDILLGEGGEVGSDTPQTYGTGGEVHSVRVLDPIRIGLQA